MEKGNRPTVTPDDEYIAFGQRDTNLPGEIVIPKPEVTNQKSFIEALSDKDVSSRIVSLQEQNKEIAAKGGIGRIIFYVAENKWNIAAAVSVAGATALGTLIFLRRRAEWKRPRWYPDSSKK